MASVESWRSVAPPADRLCLAACSVVYTYLRAKQQARVSDGRYRCRSCSDRSSISPIIFPAISPSSCQSGGCGIKQPAESIHSSPTDCLSPQHGDEAGEIGAETRSMGNSPLPENTRHSVLTTDSCEKSDRVSSLCSAASANMNLKCQTLAMVSRYAANGLITHNVENSEKLSASPTSVDGLINKEADGLIRGSPRSNVGVGLFGSHSTTDVEGGTRDGYCVGCHQRQARLNRLIRCLSLAELHLSETREHLDARIQQVALLDERFHMENYSGSTAH